jgi:hypothetical protein
LEEEEVKSGVSDPSNDKARVDVGSELSQFTILPLGAEETPTFAFFLIKTRSADGDESWSFRTSSAPNLEELLGALYGERIAAKRGAHMLKRHRSSWGERYVKTSVKSIAGSAASELEKNLQKLNQGRIDKQKSLYARRHGRRR